LQDGVDFLQLGQGGTVGHCPGHLLLEIVHAFILLGFQQLPHFLNLRLAQGCNCHLQLVAGDKLGSEMLEVLGVQGTAGLLLQPGQSSAQLLLLLGQDLKLAVREAGQIVVGGIQGLRVGLEHLVDGLEGQLEAVGQGGHLRRLEHFLEQGRLQLPIHI
jgi:hypothetical protein